MHALSFDASSVLDTTANIYELNGTEGPCGDLDSNGSCESTMASWLFETTSTYDANYMNIPMGLPFADNFVTTNTTSTALPYISQIGSTGGITNAQLKDDQIQIDSTLIDQDVVHIAAGGSYTTTSGAGTYAMDLTWRFNVSSEIGARCVIAIDPVSYDE